MELLKITLISTKKFFKGLLAIFIINLLVIGCVFLFDSCRKAIALTDENTQINNKFLNAIAVNREAIASISVKKLNNGQLNSGGTESLSTEEDLESVYLDPPPGAPPATLDLIQNIHSIQDIAHALSQANVTVQYSPTPTNSNYNLNISISEVNAALTPLVQESKEFLYARGLTESDIQQMIAEENALETDLIPLVTTIIQDENNMFASRNYLDMFMINSAQALDWAQVGHCALHALGMDVIFSIGSSGLNTWSVWRIKAAFKKVAQRFLGPVGVAIAVADFGFCLAGVEL